MKIKSLLIAASILISGCGPAGEGSNLVALLTDYGEDSFYVGALKGAILSANPAARIVDITHVVPEYDIGRAAFILAEASREFPRGTVFVAVVDPGVGTGRKCLALKTKTGKYFIGPDNGIFTLVVLEQGTTEVREIANQSLYRRVPPSATFQGRDVFGPVGARLADGFPLGKVGPKLSSWTMLPLEKATLAEGEIRGQVWNIDRYGNAITNVPPSLMKEAGFSPGDTLSLRLGERTIALPLLSTYGDVSEASPLCLINAEERLEFALNRKSFAEAFNLREGDRFEIHR